MPQIHAQPGNLPVCPSAYGLFPTRISAICHATNGRRRKTPAVSPGKLPAMRIAYPIRFTQLGSGVEAVFPDVPEASATASTHRAARAAASVRLVEALCARVDEHADIPTPGLAHRRRDSVSPPVLTAAKLALYQTMRDQNVSNVALARRLGAVEGTVRRLLDPAHRSRVDAVEAALAALGKRLVLELLTQPR